MKDLHDLCIRALSDLNLKYTEDDGWITLLFTHKNGTRRIELATHKHFIQVQSWIAYAHILPDKWDSVLEFIERVNATNAVAKLCIDFDDDTVGISAVNMFGEKLDRNDAKNIINYLIFDSLKLYNDCEEPLLKLITANNECDPYSPITAFNDFEMLHDEE